MSVQDLQFTVLIADDESTIRNGLREIIPWEMYHAQVVEAVSDGVGALAALRRFRPDLVVIDIRMPGMDGLEVIRCAREEGINSRFIILSGYNDFSLAQRAIRYGANAYILKPLKVDEFKDELSRQFAQIMDTHNPSVQSPDMNALLETSRLFLLNQLIRNELRNPDELNRRCGMLRLGFDLHAPCFMVALTIQGDDAENDPDALLRMESLLRQTSKNASSEIWRYTDKYVVALCQAPDEDTPQARSVLSALLAEISAQLGQRVIAGIGPQVPSPLHAAQSFSVALRAMSYDLYQIPGSIYGPEVICTQVPAANQPDASLNDAVAHAVESGTDAYLAQICHQYIDALFYVPMPPPDYLRGKCIALVNSLCERFNALHPGEGPFLPPQTDEVRGLRTVQELTQWLTLTLTGYQQYHRDAKRLTDPLVEAAKQYIRQHLSENIKASDVAAQVNLSASYFTIYFKAKAGCNFRDYVLNEKMKYAEELLQQGMNVSEIAYAIGYTDYRSFSRAFKNVTGHTPSDHLNL